MTRRGGRNVAFASFAVATAALAAGAFVCRGRIVEEWWLWRLEHGDERAKAVAAGRLAELGSVRAIPGLLREVQTEPFTGIVTASAAGDGPYHATLRPDERLRSVATALARLGRRSVPGLLDLVAPLSEPSSGGGYPCAEAIWIVRAICRDRGEGSTLAIDAALDDDVVDSDEIWYVTHALAEASWLDEPTRRLARRRLDDLLARFLGWPCDGRLGSGTPASADRRLASGSDRSVRPEPRGPPRALAIATGRAVRRLRAAGETFGRRRFGTRWPDLKRGFADASTILALRVSAGPGLRSVLDRLRSRLSPGMEDALLGAMAASASAQLAIWDDFDLESAGWDPSIEDWVRALARSGPPIAPALLKRLAFCVRPEDLDRGARDLRPCCWIEALGCAAAMDRIFGLDQPLDPVAFRRDCRMAAETFLRTMLGRDVPVRYREGAEGAIEFLERRRSLVRVRDRRALADPER